MKPSVKAGTVLRVSTEAVTGGSTPELSHLVRQPQQGSAHQMKARPAAVLALCGEPVCSSYVPVGELSELPKSATAVALLA